MKNKQESRKIFQETKTNLKMSWGFLKGSKKILIFSGILDIILAGLGVALPILHAQQLLKLSNGLFTDLLIVSIAIFIIEITRRVIMVLSDRILSKYMIKIITNIQFKILEETLRIKTCELDKNSSGIFIDRIKNDTSEVIDIFSVIISYVTDLISNFGIIIAIAIICPYMFIYFLVTSILIFLLEKKRRNLIYKRRKKLRTKEERITGLLTEFVRGIRDIKLLNADSSILGYTNRKVTKVNNERISIEDNKRLLEIITNATRELINLLFFILGIVLIKNNKLNIANFVILYMYRDRITSLLNIFNRFAESINRYNLSATRIFELIGDNYYAKESKDGIEIKDVIGNIEFRNVSFSYTETDVLHNVNFTINSGEKVGFVGSSGAGKSTIFNLITRLYDLENGNILIDGTDINEISYKSLRSNLGHIPQSPYIFNFSILENLKLANDNATMEEIIDACKKADIYERIMEFENGFDTIVGEGGITLSGGEKQRLAIARCLLKKCNILLFDEATSSLDNITQGNVQEAIYGLDKDKTVLIIAHRLSTVIHCDKIIVIDDGNILDIGTHEELLNRCPRYQELFKYEEVENY